MKRLVIEIVAGFVLVAGSYCMGLLTLPAEKPTKLPTIEQIQRLVGCEKIDGILGSETQEKWDRAICSQHAAKWDFMYAEKD